MTTLETSVAPGRNLGRGPVAQLPPLTVMADVLGVKLMGSLFF